MFFDDRLATVLRQRAQSDAMRRTQFRQLLDLMGSQASGARKAASDPSLVAAAWMRMSKLAETIPARDRARLIEEPGWRLRNPELVAHLAEFEPEVASAALARGHLSKEDWTTLIPRLPVRARGFLRLRRDLPREVESLLEQLGIYDRGLPQPQVQPEEIDAAPLELGANDELPGQKVPNEAIPQEPPVTSPIDPPSDEVAVPQVGSSTRSQPIFFPKDVRSTATSAQPSELQGFKPEPFTKEELREISEAPLGPDGLSDENVGDDPVVEDQGTNAKKPTDKPSPKDTNRQDDGRSEISALVERISNFQRNREQAPRPVDLPTETAADGNRLMPRLPLGEEDNARVRIVRGFAFVADAGGRIEWAEEDVAPMIVGTRLVTASLRQLDGVQDPLSSAFNQRQPLNAAPFSMRGAPAIAGDWVVDAQPRFSQIGGFSGYVGRMRRPIEQAPTGPGPAEREADRIRQLLHELRTPVTAIQGYSEVIQQQLFGSASHEYRALAAAIASDAARILAGFEELDRLSRLETGVLEIDSGQTEIAGLTQRIVRQLAQVLDQRQSGIDLVCEGASEFVAKIDEDSAESLLWRLLASLGGGCDPEERLQAHLENQGAYLRLTCDLPRQMQTEDDLFAADARVPNTAINPGIFGAGFALRLARAEAQAVSGNLMRNQNVITLTLPTSREKNSEFGSDLATS
jgi:signal transduction histidine kinase